MKNVIKEQAAQHLMVGMTDRNGKKVIRIDEGSGWYVTEDNKIRDPQGYEWYGDAMGDGGLTDVDNQRIEHDAVSGQKIVVRDFKIAMLKDANVDPKTFIEHHRKMIEATMVETGWDYADEKAMQFGEGKDGFAHIYVQMKKKNWKNRDNYIDGMKSGETGKVKSPALIKAGAVDPYIYGGSEDNKMGGDIIAGK